MHVAYCFVHTQTMFRLRCHWGNIHHCVGGIHFEPLKTRLQLASMRLFKPSNSLKQLIGIDLIQDMSPSAIQKANTVIFLQVPIFLMKLQGNIEMAVVGFILAEYQTYCAEHIYVHPLFMAVVAIESEAFPIPQKCLYGIHFPTSSSWI